MKKTKVLIIFIIFFIIGILGVIFYYERILRSGDDVVLETVSRDPWDIIRGDYIVLRYKIDSSDQVRKILENKNFKKGQTIYTILEKNNDKKVIVKDIVYQEPKTDVLYIKGIVSKGWDGGQIIKYKNIERYFVPEGKGRNIERMSGLEVLVSIKNGNAIIKSLLKNGEEIKFKDIKKKEKNFIYDYF